MLVLHILKRIAILFLLGLLVNGFPHFPLDTLRVYGVPQRIAVCYLAASILYLCSRRVAVLAGATVATLAGYWILMRFVPIPGYPSQHMASLCLTGMQTGSLISTAGYFPAVSIMGCTIRRACSVICLPVPRLCSECSRGYG
jgi:predicted acyltransferase